MEAGIYPCTVLASLKPIRTAIRPARKTGPGTGQRKDGGKAVGSGQALGILNRFGIGVRATAPSKTSGTRGAMLNPIRLVSCAAVAATSLLLNSCTHDPMEPAPVSIRGVNKTMNSTAPVVAAAPLAPPRSATASVPRAAIVDTSASHRAIPSEQATGGAVAKGKRSARAQKVHRHRVPQMAGALTGQAKAHRATKFSVSTTALARSHQREPSSRRAGHKVG